MADEPDGVDEAFEGALRVGLTVAGRVGEQVARAREQAARNTQVTSEQEARELQARFDAERSAARAQLAPVQREEWWTRAQPGDVATAWETARTWQDFDPDARRTADRIRDEVRSRYGVDVNEPRAEPAALAAAIEARENAERDAARQRDESRRDDVEAGLLMSEADRADREHDPATAATAEQDSREVYDSAERRLAMAASLEGVADTETVEARVLADTNQARPAVDAVAATSRKAPKERRQRGPAVRAKEQQKTLSR